MPSELRALASDVLHGVVYAGVSAAVSQCHTEDLQEKLMKVYVRMQDDEVLSESLTPHALRLQTLYATIRAPTALQFRNAATLEFHV